MLQVRYPTTHRHSNTHRRKHMEKQTTQIKITCDITWTKLIHPLLALVETVQYTSHITELNRGLNSKY